MKDIRLLIIIIIITLSGQVKIHAQNKENLKKAQKAFEKKLKGRGHHLDYIYHLLINDLEHSKELAKSLHDHNDSTTTFDFSKRSTSLEFIESHTIEIEHGVTMNIFLAKFNNDKLDEHFALAIPVYEVERKRLEKMSLAGYWAANETPERLAISNEYYFKDYIKRRFSIAMSEIKFELQKDFIILDDANINSHALANSEREEIKKDWSWWEKRIHPNVKFFESISIYTLGKGHTKVRLNDKETIEITPDNLFTRNQ